MNRNPVRALIAGSLLLSQAACFTAPRAVPAPTPFLQGSPKRVWVSLATGEQMVIDKPKVYGDSLLGFIQRGEIREEVWMPLSDLQEVRTRHLSGSRTTLLGGIIAVSAVVGILLIPTGGGEHVPLCTYDCDDGQ